MNIPTIQCPHCDGEITLSETLAAEHIEAAEAKHRKEIAELKISHAEQSKALNEREVQLNQQEKAIKETLASERLKLEKVIEQQVRSDMHVQLDDANKRLAEKDEKLKQAEKLELDSRQRMAAAEEKSRLADLEVQRRLDEERESFKKASAEHEAALNKKIEVREAALAESEKQLAETLETERVKEQSRARAEAEKEVSTRLLDADAQIEELGQKLKDSQSIELDALKKVRAAEEQAERSKLEVQRQLETERAQIREQALKGAAEENQRTLAEKDKHLEQLNSKIEDMKRQMESRSQQLQGELEELNVYTRLKEAFPSDELVRTQRGRNGADIELRIKTPSGKTAGIVLIEVKDTQTYSRDWISKLKGDMELHQAMQGVIVSRTLPADIEEFDQRDGVWISRIGVMVSLLKALRNEVLSVSRERTVNEMSDSTKEQVFEYLTSVEFARRISSLVDNYQAMRNSIEKQKRSFALRIKEQENALDNIFVGITNDYGDLSMRIGTSLKPVQGLEVMPSQR